MDKSDRKGLFDLTGSRALITGSSRGIGFALAKGLAEAGAAIVLNGRDGGKLERAAGELRKEGFTIATAVFDVTERDAVESSIGKIESEIGFIDILVNNAGIQHRAPLEDFPADAWERLINVNLSSVFHVSQAVAKYMIPRSGRQDHQYLFGSKSARSSYRRPLCCNERGSGDVDQGYVRGLGEIRHPSKRHCTGLFCDGNEQGSCREQGIFRLVMQENSFWTMGKCRRTVRHCRVSCVKGFDICKRTNHLCRWWPYQLRLVVCIQRSASWVRILALPSDFSQTSFASTGYR